MSIRHDLTVPVNDDLHRYPYVATEVLCSEIWSIVETSLNHESRILLPFWETVLDRPPDDMKEHMPMATHFAKINSIFMTKKPAEVITLSSWSLPPPR